MSSEENVLRQYSLKSRNKTLRTFKSCLSIEYLLAAIIIVSNTPATNSESQCQIRKRLLYFYEN